MWTATDPTLLNGWMSPWNLLSKLVSAGIEDLEESFAPKVKSHPKRWTVIRRSALGVTAFSWTFAVATAALLFGNEPPTLGWASILAGLGAVGYFSLSVSIVLSRAEARAEADAYSDPVRRLRSKAEAVENAFAEAERVMVELRGEMAAQRAAYEKAVADTEEEQKKLIITREQAEVIGEVLFAASRESDRRNLKRDIVIFLLGLITSTIAGILVNTWFGQGSP